ncbi:orotidine-5'-phosphate decarboxylase [Aristophania vespae]|uniref:Orotidine 5'-phosphate decarboxylase n=1 Tax=Aristophania vespae TaxID=2697033 RepID=A0A6P1NKX2_9PROT|nr:orotidine-5'-phosphate decarboxylase [Aristophania vespae]QHI95521.1 orotidine-5'-phosphate decarboxylase [Aristophania vespae]UMM63172.1 Orotidine 5'-phosphate decarboxylase [Aristophania vespae]
MTSRSTKLIAAIDTADINQARKWVSALEDSVDAIKLGLEFTYGCGLEAVKDLSQNQRLFLDLKLHDIPNTVASGLRSLLNNLSPELLTVHALGGPEMIERSREAIEQKTSTSQTRPKLLAVTILTSMNQQTLNAVGIADTPLDQVIRLGKMAIKAGADGLVCSAHEITALRDALGENALLVVPGIRPKGNQADDQQRVMTPAQAAQAGADWIVVGRPITKAADPAQAARAIKAELQL